MMKRFASILFVLSTALVSAKIIKVPADHTTIQSAIFAASSHDTVVVYPGTYFENLRLYGKNIVLTSRYYENNDHSYITSTIVNGSKPQYVDSASCVRIIDGEDSTMVLQGFTITGGTGTAWPDEHSPGTFIEGGGILTAFTAPIIRNNIIMFNEAIAARSGISSAGGGGIRSGDGNPTIMNNIIMYNKGKYGAGIVLNYSGGIVKNNVIAANEGGESYGGGGVWLNGDNTKPKIIENNTITGNISKLDGGGVLVIDSPTGIILRNNIIWGNFASYIPEISLRDNAPVSIEYSNVRGGWTGTGNIDQHPQFADSGMYLAMGSPDVDAGDPDSIYYDPNYGINENLAVPPALGTKRNDMGAYGGRGASINPDVFASRLYTSASGFGFGNVQLGQYQSKLYVGNIGGRKLHIDSIRVKNNAKGNLSFEMNATQFGSSQGDTLALSWNASASEVLLDSVMIYHTDTSQVSPLILPVAGKAFAIIPPVQATMYGASGSLDSGKMYSIALQNGSATLLGKSEYGSIYSLRTNPKSNELVAMTASTVPQFLRMSSESANALPIGTTSLANAKGLAFSGNGSLYIGQYNGTLSTVDPVTGVATKIASTGLRIAGLAFSPISGQLWASVRSTTSGKDNIYKIVLPGGTATLIGATGFGIPTKDITFDDKGNLYGVIDTTGSESYLIAIDTSNGKGTVIGATGVKGMEAIELHSHQLTAVYHDNNSVPKNFVVYQNYPNPFNPTTTIRYELPTAENVRVKIFNTIGQMVGIVFDGPQEAGVYHVRIDARDLASGVYYYTVETSTASVTKKFMVLK